MERAPTGFTTMAELPNLTAKLVERGHSDEVIRKILGENYLRVFSQVWAWWEGFPSLTALTSRRFRPLEASLRAQFDEARQP